MSILFKTNALVSLTVLDGRAILLLENELPVEMPTSGLKYFAARMGAFDLVALYGTMTAEQLISKLGISLPAGFTVVGTTVKFNGHKAPTRIPHVDIMGTVNQAVKTEQEKNAEADVTWSDHDQLAFMYDEAKKVINEFTDVLTEEMELDASLYESCSSLSQVEFVKDLIKNGTLLPAANDMFTGLYIVSSDPVEENPARVPAMFVADHGYQVRSWSSVTAGDIAKARDGKLHIVRINVKASDVFTNSVVAHYEIAEIMTFETDSE